MKRDNQWRPTERRYKEYAPYQRCRLKAANPVTSEEAVVISKRCNKLRHNSIWRCEPNYDLEKKLINMYIDKPCDMFIRAWHVRTRHLRKRGVPLELRYIKPVLSDNPSTWDEFYVDTEGIIRKNNEYRYRFNKNKKPIKITEKEVVKYRLREEIHNKNGLSQPPFRGILPILHKYLSTTDYNDIIDNDIDVARFNKLAGRAANSGINPAIETWAENHNKKMFGNNPYVYTWTPGYCPYVSFKDLFMADHSGSEYRHVYPGTPEHSRIMAERRDAEKKTGREYRRQLEEFNRNLLHNIEASRKAGEYEINA